MTDIADAQAGQLPRAAMAMAAAVVLVLSGCSTAPLGRDRAVSAETASTSGSTLARLVAAPPGSAPGSCWQRDVAPAVIETVTERVTLPNAAGGANGGRAIVQSETRQQILRDRQVLVFETPCPPVLTPEFIATLQRALAARGLYDGPAHGHYDLPTRLALRRFQKTQGLDSDILSMNAARALGLVAFDFGQRRS